MVVILIVVVLQFLPTAWREYLKDTVLMVLGDSGDLSVRTPPPPVPLQMPWMSWMPSFLRWPPRRVRIGLWTYSFNFGALALSVSSAVTATYYALHTLGRLGSYYAHVSYVYDWVMAVLPFPG